MEWIEASVREFHHLCGYYLFHRRLTDGKNYINIKCFPVDPRKWFISHIKISLKHKFSSFSFFLSFFPSFLRFKFYYFRQINFSWKEKKLKGTILCWRGMCGKFAYLRIYFSFFFSSNLAFHLKWAKTVWVVMIKRTTKLLS